MPDAQIDSTSGYPVKQLSTGSAAHVLVVNSTGTSTTLAEDAAHASGDPGYQMLAVRKATPANLSGTDGDYEPLQINGGRLWVEAGTAAHDAAVAGNPVRLGGRALTANYTAVATGDTADLVTTLVGAVVQKPFSIPEGDWSYVAAASGIANTTTAVTIAAAAAAGLRNYITGIQIMSEALTNATELAIRDGAGGAVLWRTKIGTAGVVNGIGLTFQSPIKGTAATLLEVVTLTASGAGAVYFNAQGYIAP